MTEYVRAASSLFSVIAAKLFTEIFTVRANLAETRRGARAARMALLLCNC